MLSSQVVRQLSHRIFLVRESASCWDVGTQCNGGWHGFSGVGVPESPCSFAHWQRPSRKRVSLRLARSSCLGASHSPRRDRRPVCVPGRPKGICRPWRPSSWRLLFQSLLPSPVDTGGGSRRRPRAKMFLSHPGLVIVSPGHSFFGLGFEECRLGRQTGGLQTPEFTSCPGWRSDTCCHRGHPSPGVH